MTRFSSKLALLAVVALVGMVGLRAVTASAGTEVPVTATLTPTCANCRTDAGGALPDVSGSRPYSVTSDGASYTNPQVISKILTNNSVYTLDTSGTLVNGLVVPGTRTASMWFYSSVECKPGDPNCEFPDNVLPPCWGGDYDQDQAVNWSIFAPISFLRMSISTTKKYSAAARLNFNVRNALCDGQINRFRVQWSTVCITHPTANTWVITSQACAGSTVNWGEAHLEAYGGTKKNTVDYGDWRLPFELTLTR